MKKFFMHSINRASTFSFGFVTAICLFAVSCTTPDYVSPEQNDDATQKNLVETLASLSQTEAGSSETATESNQKSKGGKTTFSTLNVALARTGLAGDVSKNRLTVFAPTDAAFAALGLYPNNIASVPNLKEILLYHVVAGTVYSTQLSEGFVPTLNGAAVEVKLNGGVMINDANVVQADIKARNGVIHAIDKVLFPPTKNLVELALSFDPEFSILVAAVQKAGLVDELATGGPYTVFAPTNQAFVELLGFLGAKSLDDVSEDVLKKVLLYHVVKGRVFSSDLQSGPVPTLNGTFMLDLNTLTITDANNRTAGLVPSLLNVQATNGVVHVIDTVILPVLE
jgi:uncharacterized surface protein with fasciclin (FAS1) repeats